MDLHPNIAPYGFLTGTWTGKGHGFYPTIEDFSYEETLIFSTIPGKPFFRYEQKTMGPNGPLHTELGFLRILDDGRAEFILAQPMGQTELLEGTVREEGETLVFDFTRSTVANSGSAKRVGTTARTYTFTADRSGLSAQFAMGAVGQPLQQHLESELTKQS